jgi:hypothetical protein
MAGHRWMNPTFCLVQYKLYRTFFQILWKMVLLIMLRKQKTAVKAQKISCTPFRLSILYLQMIMPKYCDDLNDGSEK